MSEALLDVSDLAVAYGDMTVLRDVDLTVPEGGVVSVVGANGAGKTTLLKTVAGVFTPATVFRSVVLPAPLAPTTETTPPSGTVRSTSRRTVISP